MSWKFIQQLHEGRWDDEPDYMSADEEKRIENAVQDFTIDAFMKDYGSEFLWNERAEYREQSPEDLELTVKDVLKYIDHYLAFAAYGDEDGDVHFGEFKHDAKDIFENILLPVLKQEGYTFTDLANHPTLVKTVHDYDQMIKAKQAEIQKYESNYNPKYDSILTKLYDELKVLKHKRIDADNQTGQHNEELDRLKKLSGIR